MFSYYRMCSPGHIIAEDMFCAFNLLWQLDMMHPSARLNSRPPPTKSRPPHPPGEHVPLRHLHSGYQILLNTVCTFGRPEYKNFHKNCDKFQRQWSAISLHPVRRTWGLLGLEGRGEACFRTLFVGVKGCSYASAKFQGAVMGHRYLVCS